MNMTPEEIEAVRSRNPFSKAHFNLTKQMEIITANPELAAELHSAVRPMAVIFNPWLKESFNLTAQMRITVENQVVAESLKKMAIKYDTLASAAENTVEIAAARGSLIEEFLLLTDEQRSYVMTVGNECALQANANAVTAELMAH